MAEETGKPVLLYRELQTGKEYSEAIDILIEMANRDLRIFDYNLEDNGYNTLQRYELLRGYLLRNRSNRLEIILHDTDYLTRFCPRLLRLCRQFSHAIAIRATTSQAKGIYDPFAIADQAIYVHRFHYDAPRALLALNDIQGGHQLIKRFEEIKEASTPAVPPTTLGL